jgi:hypothetical protein
VEGSRLFAAERNASIFLRRLAFAVSRLHQPLEKLVRFDATWSDRRTGVGDVIDFSEWKAANYSAFSAQMFAKAVPRKLAVSQGDEVQLYMRFLERKAHDKA